MIFQDSCLFLGFPLESKEFELYLNNEKGKLLYSLFVDVDGPYLKKVSVKGTPYLGKYLPKSIDSPKLKLTEANIYSILSKIYPDYPFKKTPLRLLALFSEQET